MTDKRTKHEHYFAQECMIHGVGDREVLEAICRMLLRQHGDGESADLNLLRKRLECRARLDAKLRE